MNQRLENQRPTPLGRDRRRTGGTDMPRPTSAEPLTQPDNGGMAQGGASALKLLLVASAGGHWIEMRRLSAAFRDCDCQYVSTGQIEHPPVGERPVLVVADGSRDTLWRLIRATFSLVPIMRRFKPDLVVSTGAAPGAAALLVARIFGARTIWIDSIANSDSLSLSGRAVRPIADLRLTQWQHIAERHRGVTYFGQIL